MIIAHRAAIFCNQAPTGVFWMAGIRSEISFRHKAKLACTVKIATADNKKTLWGAEGLLAERLICSFVIFYE
jgi:hypothetical protein